MAKLSTAKGQSPKPGRDDFKSVARALGCDDSEAAFDKALAKIGKSKTASPNPVKKRKRARA